MSKGIAAYYLPKEGHHDEEEKIEFQPKTKYDKYLAKMIAEDDSDESKEDIPESKVQTEKIGMAESGQHLLMDWMRQQRGGVEQLRCGARGEGVDTNDIEKLWTGMGFRI